ncbi:MAG: HD-GYP domain-containing protein, partial [Spirochaetota bacterium]
QYDELIIKALVFTLSIYPIGSHVLLTNGKRAVVIDTSPDNPRFPIVQILGASNPDGTDVKVKTTETGARILRSLSKIEIAETKQNG